MANTLDDHRPLDLSWGAVAGPRTPRSLMRPPWQRHGVLEGSPQSETLQRLFHRGGPGVRAATGICRIPGALRAGGESPGPDGHCRTSLALPTAAMGAWTASAAPA